MVKPLMTACVFMTKPKDYVIIWIHKFHWNKIKETAEERRGRDGDGEE